MKNVLISWLCLFCVFLFGCRNAMDISEEVSALYSAPLHTIVQITAITGIPCDYRIECLVDTETSTVEIIEPNSLAGLKATIESDGCKIEYEDIALDSLMISACGMTPADCLDQTVYSLRHRVPSKYSYEEHGGKECLSLTYEQQKDLYVITQVVWLEENTLALLAGDYYLDGTLVMQMTADECTFTE